MSTEARRPAGLPAEAAAAGPHRHVHPHHRREAIVRRLKRAEGHLAAVRRMVEDGRDCPDILLQIAAVRAALDATARVVLADHVESCLHNASHNGDAEAAWEDLRRALESFIR
jgi:DNA-binding FrmR family transcriptional regulator